MFIDFPKVSGVVAEGLENVHPPKVYKIRQRYDNAHIADLPGHIARRMAALPDREFYRGKQVCITAGSRGIPHYALLLRTVCEQFKAWGARPFLIPAMGSHGGATAEGQREVLAGFGVTEESVGAPICSNMEAVRYGKLANGVPLYCDKLAAQADAVVIFHKIKPHTDFRGAHESGLAKMMAIGIGKHVGAAAFHTMGFSQFARRVPEAAEQFLRAMPHVIGMGIVQNAYDQICDLEVIPQGEIMAADARLQQIAKDKIARFKFDAVDVLVIDEIGKEISGFGHDPNITGRANGYEPGFADILKINKLLILGLTEQTHHNGSGISEADITTRRCLRDIDWAVTWTNIITSTEIQGGKIPMYQNTEREALQIALLTCNSPAPDAVRLARIKNTLHMHEIEVSEQLYRELETHPEVELLEGPYSWSFDDEGNFV